MTRRRQWLAAPGLHFLVVGGLLFATWHFLAPSADREPASQTKELTGEEILFREALAAGLDRDDRLVRRRLANLGEIVAAGEVEGAVALEQEARRFGLHRTDLVVRRHLVHTMELAVGHVGPTEWPAEEELAAYYELHEDRYARPAGYRFRHVYFARDRDGVPAARAAIDALHALGREAGPPADPGLEGDAFLLGAELSLSAPEVARRLGPAFAKALEQAPVGRWIGPVASSYGQHVVRVSERTPPVIPDLESVRSRVVHAMLAEQATTKLARRLAERRAARSR